MVEKKKKNAMKTKSREDYIELAKVAELLLITPRRIQQLSAEGFIEKVGGKYTLTGCVQGYIKYLQDENRRTSKSAADSRVRDMRADEIQFRILEKKQLLLTEAKNEAFNLIDEVIGGLKADMYSIPARVTTEIPLRKKIEKEIESAFAESSKRVKTCSSDKKSSSKSS